MQSRSLDSCSRFYPYSTSVFRQFKEYQRTDLIRALTKLYGDVPKSLQADRNSLKVDKDIRSRMLG
jgi:hypothetical protein